MTSDIVPYYFPRGEGRFESTVHVQGAWNPHEQHMAPVSGLLAHSLELFQPRPELRMARLSFDILGLIPDGEFDVVTSMLRPGRTIELVQAELVSGGRRLPTDRHRPTSKSVPGPPSISHRGIGRTRRPAHHLGNRPEFHQFNSHRPRNVNFRTDPPQTPARGSGRVPTPAGTHS